MQFAADVRVCRVVNPEQRYNTFKCQLDAEDGKLYIHVRDFRHRRYIDDSNCYKEGTILLATLNNTKLIKGIESVIDVQAYNGNLPVGTRFVPQGYTFVVGSKDMIQEHGRNTIYNARDDKLWYDDNMDRIPLIKEN